MILAIFYQDPVPQKFHNWIRVPAPSELVTPGDQDMAVEFRAGDHDWLETGHGDLEYITQFILHCFHCRQ